MNEFSIRKNIPSIKVTKELIEQLEKYILLDISEIFELDYQLLKENYSLEITDELGTETLKSISDYSLSKFQEGTKNICFGFHLYKPLFLKVRISLGTNDYDSKIDISYKSSKPREKVNGIYNGILDRMKTQKNYNFLFHFPYINGAVSGIGLIIFSSTLGLSSHLDSFWIFYLLSFGILLFGLGSKIEKIKPYSEFDTQRQSRINKWFSFIFWGIMTVLIFGLYIGFFKKFLFE